MSDKPKRIQLRRVMGWRKPENTVMVTRPGKWGNPFKIGAPNVPDAETAVMLFREWLFHPKQAGLYFTALCELPGKNLCCSCPLDQPCHADVLLELANK